MPTRGKNEPPVLNKGSLDNKTHLKMKIYEVRVGKRKGRGGVGTEPCRLWITNNSIGHLKRGGSKSIIYCERRTFSHCRYFHVIRVS